MRHAYWKKFNVLLLKRRVPLNSLSLARWITWQDFHLKRKLYLILVFKNLLSIRKFIILFDFYLLNLISFFIGLSFRRDIASFMLTRRKTTISQSIHRLLPYPGTIALPSTIPRYILPTPTSYYHAACLLRPCSNCITTSHPFSGFFLCLLPNTKQPTTPTQRYHHLSKE